LRADDCCIGRKESSSADTSEHASEKEGSKRPLEKAEAAAGARCGDLRALLHDGFAKRLLSQEGEPPSASTTDREALRDFERSEKAKRLCLENEKRSLAVPPRPLVFFLFQEEKAKQKEEKAKLKEEQAKLKEEEKKLKEEQAKLRALKREEEKAKQKEEKAKLKEEQAKLRALKREEEKADAQADAQAMASKVKATLWEPGVMHECFDSIASSPYDLERGKVGCS